jgi:glycosyltransferase involved in cell wall biosynthesis
MHIPLYEELFKKHNACVLIPTYNNAAVLPVVLEKVLQYTSRVIVVNDGSTDNTKDILNRFPQVYSVSYQTNKGKGYALRTGFKEAEKLGYDNAITIDSDGQHYPEDLARFLEQLDETPSALIIGARNMNQKNVPGKSSFGNKFSNFWYWVNTGIRLSDTQSGYRLYPVNKLATKKYFTTKYEFEIEVIVRAAWSGINVISIPVAVYYPKPEERISHFRPFKDFARISILNTVLVTIALLWIKPRDFTRMLFSKEGWQTIWKAIFIHPEESNNVKAASIGFGVFMGIVPVWGFQLAIGIPLSILFRMNKALFLIAANISIFPFTPFWWFASLVTGKLLLGYHDWVLNPKDITLQYVKEQGLAFFLGGTVLAIVLGIFAFLLSHLVLLVTRKRPATLS